MLKHFILFGVISYTYSKYLISLQFLGTTAMSFLLFFLQTCGLFTYKLYIWPYMMSPLRHLPGPKGGNILSGNGKAEMARSAGMAQAEWAKDLEGTKPQFLRWISWFGEEKLTPLSSRACRLTFTNDAFVMPGWFIAGAKTILGDGLVMADGPRHHAMRKIVAPCFTPAQIRHLVPALWEKCRDLNWRIRDVIDSSGQTEVEMNIMEWTERVTFDMIGATSFGTEFKSLENFDGGFYAIYNRNYPPDGFTEPWDVLYNYVLPAFISHDWLYKLPIKAYQNMLKDRQIIKDHCQALIDQEIARKDFEDNMGNHKSLLSVLVHGKQKMSDEDTIENMMTFIAAGYGTNATALTWASYNLAMNPSVQDKLRHEIRSTLKSRDTPLTSTEMDAMKYLHQFVMESSRFLPSVPGTFRESARTTQVDGLTIPKGTQLIASILAINRSKEIWGEDAEEFRPERWADDERKRGVEHDGSFMTYLLGHKGCIGKEYSLRAVKSVIISLVSEFEFSCAPCGNPLENVVNGITMRPRGGMKLMVKVANKW